MDNFMVIMFDNFSFYILAILISAALFFLMAGIRELKTQCMEGFLYITIALFFVAVHIFYLLNIPIDNSLSYILSKMDIWLYMVIILAPALIFLFISLGLFNFLVTNPKAGLVKIFFGLSLLCYLFMLGAEWAIDIKGIITCFFSFAWFEVELETAK